MVVELREKFHNKIKRIRAKYEEERKCNLAG